MMTQAPSPLQRMVQRYEEKTSLAFKPTRVFYKRVNINRIRFSKLMHGKKSLEQTEIKTIVEFFQEYFPVQLEDLY